jgi:hypothetical protein
VLKICQHPNIIKLIDVFENEDEIFIGKLLKMNCFSNGSAERWKSILVYGEEWFYDCGRNCKENHSLDSYCTFLFA